ncbi:MAG: hypothetical protein OES27_07010 [Nitrosopumilus sp.]|nr:hypothetical protein [Nitrosopumilus sp.]
MDEQGKKCPECGKGYSINKESFQNLTITYYGCGHRKIVSIVNQTVNISEKIERDIREDYEELGKLYLGGALSAATFDPIQRGKKRFEENREKLFKFLCIENKMCEKIKKLEKHDTLTLFSTIGGLLIGSTVINPLIPIAVVSAIIVKIGVRKFCKC